MTPKNTDLEIGIEKRITLDRDNAQDCRYGNCYKKKRKNNQVFNEYEDCFVTDEHVF